MYVEALSNTLWFVNSTHFRFKGCQEQWQMSSKRRCSTYQRSGRKWIFRIFQTTYEQCETFDKTKYSDTLYFYNSRLLAYMTTGNLLKLVNSCSMILTINFMHNFLIRYPWTSWSCYRQATGKNPFMYTAHSFPSLIYVIWLPASLWIYNRELKQPQQRQEHHKFAYLTMKNGSFACFARAFFIFVHLADVLVLSTTWNDLFCSCVDNVSTWRQMFSFFIFISRSFILIQCLIRMVGKYFSR